MTPKAWRRQLAEQCVTARGRVGWKGLSKEEFTTEGPYLVTGIHFLPTGRVDWGACFRIPQWRYDESPEVMLQPGDVLVTKDGTIGKVALVDALPGPAALNSHLYAVRPIDGNLAPRFIYYALQSREFREFVGLNAAGSTIVGLPWKVFRRFEFPVPPVGEQKKIAAILSSVDESIEATQAVIDQLQVVKKAMMAELLTRGLPGRHTRFKQTEIGEVPEKWAVLPADRACEAVIDCKNRTPPYTAEGYPVIRTPNVRNGRLVKEGLRFTDAVSYAEWTARGKPLRGDVVITREAPVGEVCLIPEGMEPCLGQRMMLMRATPRWLLPEFLLAALQGDGLQTRLELISGGSTVGHVRVGDIRTLPIPIPSLDEQHTIGALFSSLAVRGETESAKLDQLRTVKASLLAVLLTGEVRVKPDEDAA
jgi:type I restriction enzyme, S subunit